VSPRQSRGLASISYRNNLYQRNPRAGSEAGVGRRLVVAGSRPATLIIAQDPADWVITARKGEAVGLSPEGWDRYLLTPERSRIAAKLGDSTRTRATRLKRQRFIVDIELNSATIVLQPLYYSPKISGCSRFPIDRLSTTPPLQAWLARHVSRSLQKNPLKLTSA
jgi:hypothetical protein